MKRMMKQTWMVKAFAAVCLLVLSLPAAAVEAPKKAIGKDTMVVVWVDMQQITPEMIETVGQAMADFSKNPMLEKQGGAVPLGEINKAVKNMTKFRDGFVKAGGQGMMMAIGMPEQGSWSPPMSMLVKSNGKLDAKALLSAMNEVKPEDEQALGEDDFQATDIGEGWHDLMIKSEDGEQVTNALPTPDAAALAAFNKQLSAGKKPAFSMAFRMQPSLREMMQGLGEGFGDQPPADPNMAMMMGMDGGAPDLDAGPGVATDAGPPATGSVSSGPNGGLSSATASLRADPTIATWRTSCAPASLHPICASSTRVSAATPSNGESAASIGTFSKTIPM